MNPRRAVLAAVPLLALCGGGMAACAYYNAMWSAEQHAKGARKAEAQGQESEARSEWALAAAKAEAVVIKHPKSRWVDDALVLEAEGLARSGSCEDATDVISHARPVAKDVALRERLDLADAQCSLAAGRPVQADAAVDGVQVQGSGAPLPGRILRGSGRRAAAGLRGRGGASATLA